MDLSDFYQTFFDEADELLADMEKHLLALDVTSPDTEALNAIFRAAHSIKGGAGTFGFSILQETTHILENLLDELRCGECELSVEQVNLFLETKDIMQDQLDAYKSSQEPDAQSFAYICEALRQIAVESKQGSITAVAQPTSVAAEPAEPAEPAESPVADVPAASAVPVLTVKLNGLKGEEPRLLADELTNLGEVLAQQQLPDTLTVQLQTTTSADDIIAVLCFILEPEQIAISAGEAAQTISPPVTSAVMKEASQPVSAPAPVKAAPVKGKAVAKSPATETSSIRVAVEKVDQIINLVGELIITQSMLNQLSGTLDPSLHNTLINSISQLERNARDLQESVMSIRMMPMEYVFSRFPRLVHDLASKLDKDVELTLKGGSAELDKSLIERIIDPLTHLVRNSLDHGIEHRDVRRAKGKPERGNLTLCAEHHGGNIIIEVIDDGAGLNREKILDKARSQGLAVGESLSDEDVWMLIFAPGFSTAEKVTDVSGRGVGMDVVRRNIQEMGGHVEIVSAENKGSTIRIILPLTLAILDGMSVRAGEEIFVLPLGTVMESLQPADNALYRMTGGEQVLQVRGEYLPLVELKHLFDIPSAPLAASECIAVILQSAGCRYALLVDQLIGQHQVVVKNLELNYRKVPGISAATILGDGRVALILDVVALPELSKDKRISDKSDYQR